MGDPGGGGPCCLCGQSLTWGLGCLNQAEVDLLGVDGILYKGRMTGKDRARPLTGAEKEVAGEERHPAWAPCPGSCLGWAACGPA